MDNSCHSIKTNFSDDLYVVENEGHCFGLRLISILVHTLYFIFSIILSEFSNESAWTAVRMCFDTFREYKGEFYIYNTNWGSSLKCNKLAAFKTNMSWIVEFLVFDEISRLLHPLVVEDLPFL